MKKKLTYLAVLSAILISLTPVSALGEEGRIVKFGEDVYLTTEKPYLKSDPETNILSAVGSCDISSDETCLAYLSPEKIDFVTTLYLNNYSGPEIYYKSAEMEIFEINFSGKNVITSTAEYGIYYNNLHYRMNYLYANSPDSKLTINLDSSTTVANGIRSYGRLMTNSGVNLEINVSSALPSDEISTDNVTGITVEGNEDFYSNDKNTIKIFNPTGNYAVSAKSYRTGRNEEYCSELFSPEVALEHNMSPCHIHGIFTHKITNGIGDFILGNDFEGHRIEDPFNIKVIGPSPTFTFSHLKSETLGTFMFLPAIDGVNAKVDESIQEGDDFRIAENQLKNSLKRDDEVAKDICNGISCASSLFEIDPENSHLENLTNPENKEKIEKDNEYLFWIAFKTIDSSHGFTIDWSGPFSWAIINGKIHFAQLDPFNRSDDAFFEEFGYSPVVLESETKQPDPEPIDEPGPDPEPIEEPEPEPEPILPDPEPLDKIVETPGEIEIIQARSESPKNPPENPTTFDGIPLFFGLFSLSFVIQLTYYGKVIFSLRRDGLRKNDATPPSRL